MAQEELGEVDSSLLDAVVEAEDHSDPSRLVAEDGSDEDNSEADGIASGTDNSPLGCPNNDFCFTEEDFLEQRNDMNDATRHQGTYQGVWSEIRAMVGEEVETKSSKDGNIVWKIVESVTDDDFNEIRKKEEAHIQKSYYSVYDELEEFSEEDYNKSFWSIWPADPKDDIKKMNAIIEYENIGRKENFQRVIRVIKKSEFIIFHALIIAAAAYSEQGDKLWQKDEYGPQKLKKRKGLSSKIDFGNYMKLWRFRQIQQYISTVMEDPTIKEKDDWWRFRKRLIDFNKIRETKFFGSHIFVFDESMSAFVPR